MTSAAGKYLAGIIMGSDSDYPVVLQGLEILKNLSITYKITVASAHRTPNKVRKFVADCEKQGVQVFIAAAGGAAHLPGVIAAETIKPVIGIPITSSLSGLDSLLSIVQMPGGIPVAAMAIGKAGAKNAALFAAEIIALSKPQILKKLMQYREHMRKDVEKKSRTY
ncbi:MAG: 5-(carboxyamino)imidazole ribonucleotide mutase [bacterium]